MPDALQALAVPWALYMGLLCLTSLLVTPFLLVIGTTSARDLCENHKSMQDRRLFLSLLTATENVDTCQV